MEINHMFTLKDWLRWNSVNLLKNQKLDKEIKKEDKGKLRGGFVYKNKMRLTRL